MARECKAPVFKGNSVCACLILTITYILVIAVLLIFIWIPSVLCLIKQYVFRIKHCRKGNSNPDILL